MKRDLAWVLDEKYGRDASAPGFAEDKRRLEAGEPAAYIIGHQPFLGLTIRLDSKPLIPRPETEWWTEALLSSPSTTSAISEALRRSTDRATLFTYEQSELVNKKCPRGAGGNFSAEKYSVLRNRVGRASLSFLDLCAGSGAIGCAALARLPDARVYFGEIDPAHEATIRTNIRENNLDELRADIRIGDLFSPFGKLTFDVIAANPPYLPEDRVLQASVADYEPALALRAGDDGLAIIRRIASALPRRLNPGGIALIECDSDHAERARALFEAAGLASKVIPDQYGEPRVIEVSSKQ